jgi:phage gp29-like protein
MGVIDNIFKSLGYNKTETLPKKADVRKAITSETQIFRIRTDMQSYRTAVISAENIHTPQRYLLYQLYEQTTLDSQITSVIQQRKTMSLSKEWCVFNPDGTENEEKTKLIRQKWFNDFLDHSLDSIFYGYSLVQFESIENINGVDQFKCVDLVPRIYVKPEFHIVVNDTAANTGTDYTAPPFDKWCIGVGKPKDLGLLMKLAPLQIWKKNAQGAWAEYIEKFGTPIRIGKTNSRDSVTVDNMKNMLKNMGVSAWGVFDLEDQLELIETTKTDAYRVYDMMIERCNSEIAKLILNQTGTTDEKSFVGSAEVHERVMQKLGWVDEKFLCDVCNYQLLPLLNAHGFGMEGLHVGVGRRPAAASFGGSWHGLGGHQ